MILDRCIGRISSQIGITLEHVPDQIGGSRNARPAVAHRKSEKMQKALSQAGCPARISALPSGPSGMMKSPTSVWSGPDMK